MSTPTAYQYAVDKLHEVGDRLPIDRALDVHLPDHVIERLADDLGDGVDALKQVLVPAAAAAVDTSRQAAGSTRRLVQRHPLLVASGVIFAIGAIALIVGRRRRDADDGRNHADLASVA